MDKCTFSNDFLKDLKTLYLERDRWYEFTAFIKIDNDGVIIISNESLEIC